MASATTPISAGTNRDAPAASEERPTLLLDAGVGGVDVRADGHVPVTQAEAVENMVVPVP